MMTKIRRFRHAILFLFSTILPWINALSHHAATPYVAADAPRIGDMYMSVVFTASLLKGFALRIRGIVRSSSF
jgi:hypothetical protein